MMIILHATTKAKMTLEEFFEEEEQKNLLTQKKNLRKIMKRN